MDFFGEFKLILTTKIWNSLNKPKQKDWYLCSLGQCTDYWIVRKNRINIRFLSLFLIGLVFSPIVLKSVHKHNSPILQNCYQHFPSIDKHQETCLICQFEFVNFIVKAPFEFSALISSIKVNFPLKTFEVVLTPFCYFQLRAPPAWVIWFSLTCWFNLNI